MKNDKYNKAWLPGRKEYFDALEYEIESLKNKGVFDNKKICLVGVWNNAGEMNEIFIKQGLKITNIADNNKNKQGVSRLGIISQSVNSLIYENDIVIIVANNAFWQNIRQQLLKLDFKENKDFFILFGGEHCKNLAMENVNLKMMPGGWENCKNRIIQAYEEYVELQKKYNDIPIWVMHQPSLGDLYIFSLYLPYIMRVDNISECNCVLIVTKKSVEKLAHILGFKNVELITFEHADQYWKILMRAMGDKINVYNAVFHGTNSSFENITHYADVTFADSFTKFVFQFRDNKEPIYPIFSTRKKIVDDIFLKYKLKKGKTILISPYAGHFVSNITTKNWETLINMLLEKGYSICTNCGSSEEKELPGTIPVFLEIQDCVEFVEQAGGFIGIRSGFCDLLCMADCIKAIIYETGAPAANIKYFGFERMKIGNNINEYVDDCIHTDIMLKNIADLFM